MDNKKSIKKSKLKVEFKTRKRKAEAIFSFLDTVVDNKGASFEPPKPSIANSLLQSSLLPSYQPLSFAHSAQAITCDYSTGFLINYANPDYNTYAGLQHLAVGLPLTNSVWALSEKSFSVGVVDNSLCQPITNSYATIFKAGYNDLEVGVSAYQPIRNSVSVKYHEGYANGIDLFVHQPTLNSLSAICKPLSNSFVNNYEARYSCRFATTINNDIETYCGSNNGTTVRVRDYANTHSHVYAGERKFISYVDDVVFSNLKTFESNLYTANFNLDSSYYETRFQTKGYFEEDIVTRIASENIKSFEKYIEEYHASGGFYESFKNRIEEAITYFGDGKVVKYLRKLFKKIFGVGHKIFTLSWSCRLFDLRNIIRKRIKNFHSCIGEEDELEYSVSKHEKYSINLHFIYTNEKRNYRTAC